VKTTKRKVRKFTKLPSVLIQEPQTGSQYFIGPDDLSKYEVTQKTWAKIGPETVTFVIPDPDYVTEVPPFLRSGARKPSILIQWPRGNKAYFLSNAVLRRYKAKKRLTYGDYGISFVLPVGLEFVEELPILIQALLQSGESGTSS